ncbi:thioredoxin [Dyella solisilvae]|uniref:Thioredoxin n=1 Tax=Dyella solisilvae TaxID=1920168 RepID=A0A370K9T8_9GAMM|nr:redoxin domain-containing protein [Dyella solisilvae]RDI99414.1 thioredoxin [Dyella solisilvae]
MSFLRVFALIVVVAALGAAAWPGTGRFAFAQEHEASSPAPDFAGPGPWFNSPPLTLSGLRGKVVLVEFWTRECINCIHVLPHTRELYDRYAADGLVVVGVHTPEYDEEHDLTALKAAIHQYRIDWPVVADNDSRIWNAYGNQFWPAIYLIDRDGRLVYSHFGEGNYEETERRVRALLGKA